MQLWLRSVVALTAWTAWLAAMPAGAAEPTIGVKDAADIVRQISDLLQKNYPFPNIATAYTAALTTNMKAGRYNDLGACALAERLTADLRAAHKDLHLEVNCHQGLVEAILNPKEDESGPAHYVVDRVALDPTLRMAYIKSPGPWSPTRDDFERIQNAMGMAAGARYVIIDITGNGGGSGDIGNFLASYFYPVGDDELMNVGLHRDGVEEPEHTFPYVPGPRFADAKLYILVDATTASAAEGFAFALQRLKRATIVGEQTAGAGIAAFEAPLPRGLSIMVPNKLIVAPGTKTGWEGVGVTPDIVSKQGEETDTALKAIGQEAAAAGLVDVPSVTPAPAGYVAPPAPRRESGLKVTGNLEACSRPHIERDLVTIVNSCGEDVTYQFLTSLRPDTVLETLAKPGETVRIGFAGAGGPYWWISSACPTGYYSDPPAREQYRDALAAGHYTCVKPAP